MNIKNYSYFIYIFKFHIFERWINLNHDVMIRRIRLKRELIEKEKNFLYL